MVGGSVCDGIQEETLEKEGSRELRVGHGSIQDTWSRFITAEKGLAVMRSWVVPWIRHEVDLVAVLVERWGMYQPEGCGRARSPGSADGVNIPLG
jgi:hypothetical protein